jgi:hypothetical protein
MKILGRTVLFGLATGVFSLVATYKTVGLPFKTTEDFVNIGVLFVLAMGGGIVAYRQDPEAAWAWLTKLLLVWRK